jgi:acyl transferase domain-containing protein/SAM-dependent methyltransferase/nucleoside-diphosphate-sugar epimerase/acyl carrier protein
MLHLINCFAHGFVAVPVILACRQHGVLTHIGQHGPLDAAVLAQQLALHEGHLRVALRLLHSLDWLHCDRQGRYTLAPGAQQAQDVPEGLLAFYGVAAGSQRILDDPSLGLAEWLRRATPAWPVDTRLATLLDGALLLPVLFALRERGLPRVQGPAFDSLAPGLRSALTAFFASRGLATGEGEHSQLTDAGRHLVERLLVLGVTASYTPLLARLPQLLRGDASAVFEGGALEPETHVDRRLNVVASGFQHEKYFEAFTEAVDAIFDRLPLHEQPCAIADMGAGDGTLLRRLYEHIASRTARGRALGTHPLVMIAVDYHREALEVATSTLAAAGVPHRAVLGDIGDPQRLARDLAALEGIAPDGVLHVRSFLDHDRPWQPPADTPAVQARIAQRRRARHGGVFVAPDGSAIDPAVQMQALVGHLRGWAQLARRHGLLVLEVHALDADTVRVQFDQCESLHFDALQGFSRQHLVEAQDFLLAAAEAGLFARAGFPQRYPRTLPFCRITLNAFECRPYTLRLATQEDLPQLLALEEACWTQALRAPADTLLARIERFPRGQFALELDGRVVGALYTQRIASVEALAACTFAQAQDLHEDHGEVLQLLAVSVLPQVQHLALGDQLLEFVLQYAALLAGVREVAGVTRCAQFTAGDAPQAYEAHVRARNERGEPRDPVLAFHVHHGARIDRVLPCWRPEDVANGGAGVLVRYDPLDRQPGGDTGARAADGLPANDAVDPQAVVARCVRNVLGPRRVHRYAPRTAFRDMGLDSLDLLELRSALVAAGAPAIEPTFFFRHATPDAVAAFLRSLQNGGAQVPVDERAQEETDAGGMPAAAAPQPTPGVAEPIAIVGMACRFPGGAVDAGSFWRLLREGRDCIGDAPSSRGNGELAPGRLDGALRRGGWLPDADRFDAGFFGIAPREAQAMDPQQRLLLEVAWDALEHAGLPASSLEGTAAGVFVGLFGHDYENLLHAASGEDERDIYFSTGVAPSVAAGRIAYVLGLQGPALAVDTACSSSLVALHLACRSLQAGECKVALAGGVNLVLSPEASQAFGRAGMLSPQGRCGTFGAAADGYVRAEGCGMLVLKPLSRALADGDTVHAVVRGSAVNQDGRSNGLTAPNGAAQESVLRAALAAAGVASRDVAYVEAHGTGTALGDPVEMQALQAVYGQGRTPGSPLLVGSVKTNIGHAEAAAGVAGLIKAVLALREGEIPASLHAQPPSARIDWDTLPTRVPGALQPWPGMAGAPRLAAVSSFGYSGTNAHVVLQAPPARSQPEATTRTGPHLLCVSAHDEQALAQRIDHVLAALERPDAHADAICHSAGAGRDALACRIAVTGDDAGALAQALRERARQPVASAPSRGIAFLFTGQGSQWHGMGADLARTEPVFRRTLQDCEAWLREEPGHADGPGLLELLHGASADPRLHQTMWTQPALFAFELALARLWQAWGVQPAAVLGHSVGEFAAACVAGVFDARDGLRLVAARGRLMQALPAGGAMVSVRAGIADVQDELRRLGLSLEVAAHNSPQETVLTGAQADVDRACEAFAARQVRTVRLQTSHAFHSRLLEPMLQAFGDTCASVAFRAPTLPLVSNVTGELAGDDVLTPAYWVQHARRPVQFARGVATLLAQGHGTLIEIGPRPVLTALARGIGDADPARRHVASIVPGEPARGSMLAALGTAFEAGARIEWKAVVRGPRPAAATLPPYPFQRQRHWLPQRAPRRLSPGSAPHGHPLLGARLPLGPGVHVFENRLGAEAPRYVREHRVRGAALLPAAAILQMALAAAGAARMTSPWLTVGADFLQPLVLPPTDGLHVQAVLAPDAQGSFDFRLLAPGADADGVLHAQARLQPGDAPSHRESPAQSAERLQPGDVASCAERWRAGGLDVTTALSLWQSLWVGPGEALVRLAAPAADAGPGAALDAALLAALPALGPSVHVLEGIDAFTLAAGDPQPAWCHARRGPDAARADLSLFDAAGRCIGTASGCRLRALPATTTPAVPLLVPTWEPEAKPAASLRDFADRLRAEFAPSGAASAAALAQGLEALAGQWIRAAFAELGWQPVPGSAVDPDALAAQLRVIPSQHRLFRRLLQVLQDDGVLRVQAGGLTVDAPWREDAAQAEAQLTTLDLRFPHAKAELQLLARCGRSLAGVLRGTVQPLSLLFPPDDPGLLGRLYLDSPTFAEPQQLLGRALGQLAAAHGSGRRLRVLEIGAGTGSSTDVALRQLPPGRFDYDFTDVSAHFLHAARQRFGTQPGVAFRRLDIAAPPAAQGFEPHAYDIVIAANVLHATRDLASTVGHARTLLAPGGTLLLLEATGRRRWIDLVFGLLDGWWCFADTALRPDYPLLDPDRWTRLLESAGLEQATAIDGCAAGADAPLPQSVLLARAPSPVGDWLFLADKQGAARRVAAAIQARGGTVSLLEDATATDLRQALERTGALAGVIDFRALDLGPGDGARACDAPLALVQALARRTGEAAPLWLVTRGAQALPGDALPAPAQAPVWGLALAVQQEHPALGCRVVDLDPAAGDQAVDAFAGTLTAATREGDRVAWRGGPFVQRFVPAAGSTPLPLDAGTAHLVTGATGGLGRHLAAWLVRRGSRRLVLVSRRATACDRGDWVQALRAQGARVTLHDVDVGDRHALAALLGSLEEPLQGVYHCAGAYSDALLAAHEPRRFAQAFAAKAAGAQHLDDLTRGQPLREFVLCSSVFSLVPAAGLASYAAANAFLDMLAARRRAEGLPALSVNWGPWHGVGMAAALGAERERQWAAAGIRTLSPAAALEALDRALALDVAQVAIARLDDGAQQPTSMPAAAAANAPAQDSGAALLQRLQQTPAGGRGAALLQHVRTRASAVLGFSEGELDVQRSLFSVGMDSLTALELRARLERDLQRALPATLLLEHPSAAALARHLQALLDPQPAGASAVAEAAPVPPESPAPASDLQAELDGIETLIKSLQ